MDSNLITFMQSHKQFLFIQTGNDILGNPIPIRRLDILIIQVFLRDILI